MAALALALLLPAAANGAPPVTWDESAHPSASGRVQMFRGVDAAAEDDVWAIGYAWGTVGGALEFRTVAQHFDGLNWTTVPTPDVETAPAKDLLFDVSAAAPDNVWAAGVSATAPGNLASKPLVIRWNGSAWSIVPVPATVPVGSSFSAIAANGNEVWAVGEQRNPQSPYWKPLIMHRVSGVWVEAPLPATPGCKAAPDKSFWRYTPGGITVRENGDVYVSGSCTSEVGERGVLAFYRNGKWRSAFDPTTLGADATSHLNDVDAVPGHKVLAVGDVGTKPLVLRGNEARFAVETPPTVGTATSLTSVQAGVPAYAVGTVTLRDAWAHPGAYRFKGAWRSETVSSQYGNPFGVTTDPAGNVFGVGVSVEDDFGLILRRSLWF